MTIKKVLRILYLWYFVGVLRPLHLDLGSSLRLQFLCHLPHLNLSRHRSPDVLISPLFFFSFSKCTTGVIPSRLMFSLGSFPLFFIYNLCSPFLFSFHSKITSHSNSSKFLFCFLFWSFWKFLKVCPFYLVTCKDPLHCVMGRIIDFDHSGRGENPSWLRVSDDGPTLVVGVSRCLVRRGKSTVYSLANYV